MSMRLNVIFVVMGVMIGVFFAAQFGTDVPLDSVFPADQYQARRNLMKDFIDEQGVLRDQIATLNRQINEQQKKNQVLLSSAKLSYLDELKRLAGLAPITGEGLQIALNDSPGANRESAGVIPEALVQASDLRDLVNLLRTGSPEAISINNQRVLPTTHISAVGNSILVNNFYAAPPFVILVTGDQDFLYSRLRETGVLAELKKRAGTYQLQFDLTPKSHINIPSYNGNFRLKYVATEGF